MTWCDGRTYEGGFKDGHENGKGTIILSDGEKRVGKFKDNSMQGRGIITFLKGHTREGDKSLVIMKDNQVIKYKHVLPKLKKNEPPYKWTDFFDQPDNLINS